MKKQGTSVTLSGLSLHEILVMVIKRVYRVGDESCYTC